MKNFEVNRIAKKFARLYGDDMKKVEGYIGFLLSQPKYSSSASNCKIESLKAAKGVK